MYNFKRAFSFILLFCTFALIWFFPKLVYRRELREEVPVFIVAYKNRFWLVSDSGNLLGTATLSDLARRAFVSQVFVSELKVNEESLNAMNKIRDVLSNPFVTEVKLEDKCAILLKGIVLYFNEWNDLVTHGSRLEMAIKTMEPKSEYFLSSSGLFYKLRGDENEKN